MRMLTTKQKVEKDLDGQVHDAWFLYLQRCTATDEELEDLMNVLDEVSEETQRRVAKLGLHPDELDLLDTCEE